MRNKSPVKVVAAQEALQSETPIPLGVRIGKVCEVDEITVPWVDFPGNTNGPQAARLALSAADAMRLSADWPRLEVLIAFDGQDVCRPVITGLVSDSLALACAPALEPKARVELQAGEELQMQCGEARIVLRRDGKVIIGGREIDTRARQKHRIRGGTIAIN